MINILPLPHRRDGTWNLCRAGVRLQIGVKLHIGHEEHRLPTTAACLPDSESLPSQYGDLDCDRGPQGSASVLLLQPYMVLALAGSRTSADSDACQPGLHTFCSGLHKFCSQMRGG